MSWRSCLAVAAALVRPVAAEPIKLTGDWWQAPAATTRHTTLVAGYDAADSNDADFARGRPPAGGFGMDAAAAGKHGGGVAIAQAGGHLHYLGASNFNPDRGTLRVQVKGDVWSDPTPRWLWEARGLDRIGVVREPGKIALAISQGWSAEPLSRVELTVGTVDPAAWHSLVASWERDTGTGWLAFDGAGETGPLTFPARRGPLLALYLGGGFGGRQGGLNLPGLAFDDLVVYDQPLPALERAPAPLPGDHAALVERTEPALRKCYDLICDLQRWGGWQTLYTWPTLLGSSAQGREYVDFDDYVSNDKSNITPHVGARLLYAWQVLGDHRYFEAAQRVGEFLLAAQDQRGFWVHGYRMTVHGIQPAASETMIKLQDSVQSHPIFFLTYLNRLTGDERCLAAVQRAGAFYLAAQNPNGSWSHHYDAKLGAGVNAIGQPGGGELNDRCTNDAIDVMVLLHHVTGEARYLEAVRRAGQWLIDARLKGAVCGWADQYGPDNQPAWARAFEPPAWSATATDLAARALVEVYRLSGDERYLQPLRDCLAWLDKAHPDGQVSDFLDPATGRAIAAWERQVYFLDEPASVAFLKTVPIGSGYTKTVAVTGRLMRVLDRAAVPNLVPALDAEALRARLETLRPAVDKALAGQSAAGVWLTPVVADFMGSLGQGFALISHPANNFVRYLETARMVMGELPAEWRGDGNILSLAWPRPDWYHVAWPAP